MHNCDGHLGSSARSEALVLLMPNRNLQIKGLSMLLLLVRSRQKGLIFIVLVSMPYQTFAGYLTSEYIFF